MIKRSKAPKGAGVRVSFVLPQGEPAGVVSVVGTFNDWRPGASPLVKRSNGTRSVAVTVPAGTLLHFRYLGEGDYWFDDPEADWVTADGGFIQT